MDTNATNKKILEVILDSLKYMPFVYREIKGLEAGERNDTTEVFYIKHKADALDPNALIFFKPDNDGKENNIIKILTPLGGFDTTKSKSYKVFYEDVDGQYREARAANISSNRILMLSVIAEPIPSSNVLGKLVILNDPNKGVMNLSGLHVSGAVTLDQIPLVGNGIDQYRLVKLDELQALEARVKKLEERILIGTDDPAQALQDQPEGTIYLQVDYYGNENK